MAFRKVKELAVVVGTYTDGSGEEKKRWKNIGAALKGDDGSIMLLIDRSFNPAGVPYRDGADQIAVSMFDPREQQTNNGGSRAPAPAPTPTRPAGVDDDIPF